MHNGVTGYGLHVTSFLLSPVTRNSQLVTISRCFFLLFFLVRCGFKYFPGDAFFVFCDVFRGAGGDDLAAFGAAAGAYVDDPVCGFNDVEVMFDDDNGIAGVYEFVEYVKELRMSSVWRPVVGSSRM